MTVPLNLVLVFWFLNFKKAGQKKPALGGLG
jgi:hypothetical protein